MKSINSSFMFFDRVKSFSIKLLLDFELISYMKTNELLFPEINLKFSPKSLIISFL